MRQHHRGSVNTYQSGQLSQQHPKRDQIKLLARAQFSHKEAIQRLTKDYLPNLPLRIKVAKQGFTSRNANRPQSTEWEEVRIMSLLSAHHALRRTEISKAVVNLITTMFEATTLD